MKNTSYKQIMKPTTVWHMDISLEIVKLSDYIFKPYKTLSLRVYFELISFKKVPLRL